jgi:carbon monoxide dehydrogenase subunit G
MASSNTYVVERRRHVAAPPDRVLERLIDLRRWESWSPWEDLDPDMRRTYGGTASGVGAWYEWDGNRRAGRGRMEIVAADDATVTIDLRFLKPLKSHSTTEFLLEPEGDGTLVTWRLTGTKTPLVRVMGIFTSMDKMIGPDFEKGLVRLQTEAEAGGGPATDSR